MSRRAFQRFCERLAGGQAGGALVESVTAPLTMTQHGWDKLYAEYKESGE